VNFNSRLAVQAFVLTAFAFASVAPSHSTGFVSADLGWGSDQKNYTYVFKGQVLCGNDPCAASRLVVSLLQGSEGGPSEEVVPDEKGFYQVSFSLPGVRSQSLHWKIYASAPKPNDSREQEAAGRVILQDGEAPITIAKSFHL
jgi:hypothetical protein